MNLQNSTRGRSGTALLVTLFLCTILAVTIAGYLQHARQQNLLSNRSQVWNMTIAVTEAGVEEALQHLNDNCADLSVDGWTKSGSVYSVARTLDSSTRYTVSIDASSMSQPVITAQAYISSGAFGLAMINQVPMLAIGGDGVSIEGTTPTISRAIRVTTGRSGMFLKAMVAKHLIDMNGNNVLTDSFDSTDPNHSTNGKYPVNEPSKRLDSGDVASNDAVVNTINIGNANIYGHVAVGPGGTISVGSQGGVGTHLWQSFYNGIQPGYFTDDMNFTFPNVTLPYSTGLTPSSGTFSTTNYAVTSGTNTITTATYPSPVPATGVQTNFSYATGNVLPSPVPFGSTTNVLTVSENSKTYPASGTYLGAVTQKGTRYYYARITGTNFTWPSLTFSYLSPTSSTNFTVTSDSYDYVIQGGDADLPPVDYYLDTVTSGNILVTGNARLVVRNNFSLGGNGSKNALTIASDGKLEMFVGGTSLNLSGNGVVNHNGFAQNFICWCTDSVTSLALSGNGEFTGVLVAPNADVRMNGGGSSDEDFIGALIAKSVTLNGHYSFHYDEALKNYKGGGRYIITAWDEIPVSQLGN